MKFYSKNNKFKKIKLTKNNNLRMKKHYNLTRLNFLLIALSITALVSCHKGNQVLPTNATPIKIGLYEYSGQGSDYTNYTYYESDIPIATIGNQTVNYQIIFDTGSGGMVIDAANLIPASMITTNGFNFTGDSTVVNGITITNQTGTIKYGANDATADKVYGNLAYAQVTIGDQNGSVVVKRLPFLLYYKAVNSSNVSYQAHFFDIFGSSEIYDLNFANNVNLTSPFSFCTYGTGLINGFKLAAVDGSQFSSSGTYVAGAITLGLTSNDLSASSGFILNPISFNATYGYFPYISGIVNYKSSPISTHLLFDTGTNFSSIIDDPNFTGTGFSQISPNSSVTVSTNSGFNYNFTVTSSTNLSFVEAATNGFSQSIMGIEYFFKNEFLCDLKNHQIGLKNN